MQLKNKVAVVTGSSGDIGKKIIQKFSEEVQIFMHLSEILMT